MKTNIQLTNLNTTTMTTTDLLAALIFHRVAPPHHRHPPSTICALIISIILMVNDWSFQNQSYEPLWLEADLKQMFNDILIHTIITITSAKEPTYLHNWLPH